MKPFLDYLEETETKNPFIAEQASAGATSSANVASVNSLFGGASDQHWRSFYPAPKRPETKKAAKGSKKAASPSVLRRAPYGATN